MYLICEFIPIEHNKVFEGSCFGYVENVIKKIYCFNTEISSVLYFWDVEQLFQQITSLKFHDLSIRVTMFELYENQLNFFNLVQCSVRTALYCIVCSCYINVIRHNTVYSIGIGYSQKIARAKLGGKTLHVHVSQVT